MRIKKPCWVRTLEHVEEWVRGRTTEQEIKLPCYMFTSPKIKGIMPSTAEREWRRLKSTYIIENGLDSGIFHFVKSEKIWYYPLPFIDWVLGLLRNWRWDNETVQ